MNDLSARIEQMRNKKRAKRSSDRVARELEQERVGIARTKKRKEMRLKFPETAKLVDEFRAQGVEVKVLSVQRVDSDG